MLGLTDIRKGKIIVLDSEPYLVTSAEFLRKQKSRPVVRSVLKHLRSGQTKEHTFTQSDRAPEAEVTKLECQFLYKQNSQYVFMDQNTYEQFELSHDLVEDTAIFLLEGQTAEIVFFEGAPVSLVLPIKIDRQITSAPPGVRGDTSTNVMKEVVIEGGGKIKAPLFINEGDKIRIDTRTGTYVARVQ